MRVLSTSCALQIAGHKTGFGSPTWLEKHAVATNTAPPVAALLEAGVWWGMDCFWGLALHGRGGVGHGVRVSSAQRLQEFTLRSQSHHWEVT